MSRSRHQFQSICFPLFGFEQTNTHVLALVSKPTIKYWQTSWSHSLNSDLELISLAISISRSLEKNSIIFMWRMKLCLIDILLQLRSCEDTDVGPSFRHAHVMSECWKGSAARWVWVLAHPDFSFLLICTLGGSRWWSKFLAPC